MKKHSFLSRMQSVPNFKQVVFLDRDGTLIRERNYLSNVNEVELLPNAARGLRHLRKLGYGLIVITNQSAIGRGFFNEDRLNQIHDRMLELLNVEGVTVDGLYFCPHIPSDLCACRKPEPGLLIQASRDFEFDLHRSFIVGDKFCDIEAGRRVACTTFLVRTGYGVEHESRKDVNADYCVDDLYQMSCELESQSCFISKESGAPESVSL